jgi:hypothetical protein
MNNAEARLAADNFLVEAGKWGKGTRVDFSVQDILDILRAYETALSDLAIAALRAEEAKSEAHQRYVAELTGKIGGLTKQLNAQKK